MRRISKGRGLRAVLVVGVLAPGLLIPVGASAATNSTDPGGTSSGGPVTSMPGVQAEAGGWLDYTSTLASGLTLTNVATTTLTGTREADGSCDISGSGTAAAGSAATFEEEIAFNPQTCQERVTSGTLSASDLSRLPTDSDTPVTGTATDSGTNAATASPDATSYQEAYEKTAWIDPLDITITSLADNLKWPLYGAGGTLTARVNPYDFKYDGWSTTGPSKIAFKTLPGNAGWSVNETDHFTNTDFAAFVYAVFGVAGWLACGAPLTATAHFNHNVTVSGYRSGGRGWAWNDSKSGACSDLVHHGQWNGFGWTS